MFAHPISSTHREIGNKVRWTAPELLSDTIPRPTTKTDVYSFASVCLEVSLHSDVHHRSSDSFHYKIFSRDVPYRNVDHDADVARLVIQGERPSRPLGDGVPDRLWDLMHDCWLATPTERPKMHVVLNRLDDDLCRSRTGA